MKYDTYYSAGFYEWHERYLSFYMATMTLHSIIFYIIYTLFIILFTLYLERLTHILF